MKTPSRKQLREAINTKSINSALMLPKGTLTKRQQRFAQNIALHDMTGADAYRNAGYSMNQSKKTQADNASRLKADSRIQAEIRALEQAKELATWHSAEALRSLVISTLTKTIIDEDTKPATRIQAAKILGQVTEVSAFTTRSEVTHIQDSDSIRSQILDQLKSMMLSSDDAVDVDASDLLTELVGAPDDPTPPAPPQNQNGTPAADLHTIPHEPPQQFSDVDSDHQSTEDPPLQVETFPPQGDIFLENEQGYQDATGNVSTPDVSGNVSTLGKKR